MPTQHIQPTGTYILIHRVGKDNAIVIPSNVDDPNADVAVLAIGPKVEQIKPGDKILLRPNANVLAYNDNTALVDASSVVAILP